MQNKKISEFTAQLASNLPVPGGGGASALVGAVGVALGHHCLKAELGLDAQGIMKTAREVLHRG